MHAAKLQTNTKVVPNLLATVQSIAGAMRMHIAALMYLLPEQGAAHQHAGNF